jgi:hypothetical protein
MGRCGCVGPGNFQLERHPTIAFKRSFAATRKLVPEVAVTREVETFKRAQEESDPLVMRERTGAGVILRRENHQAGE